MIAIAAAALLGISVGVEPAFLECRPPRAAGPFVIEAANDGTEGENLTFEIDDGFRTVEVPIELAAPSRKRIVLLAPGVSRRTTMTLVAEDGRRTRVEYDWPNDCEGVTVLALVREDGRSGLAWPPEVQGSKFDVGELRFEDLDAPWGTLEYTDVIAAEARTLTQLADERWKTLAEWVRTGGALVIVPGIDPGPLSRSGRLPEGVMGLAEGAMTRWDSGLVIVKTPSSGDAALAASLFSVAAEREIWRNGMGRLYEKQREMSGPYGAGPVGVLSLGIVLLAAAVVHEIMRRQLVTRSRRLPLYFQAAGSLLLGAGVAAAVVALSSRGGAVSADVLVVRGSAGIALRARAVPLRSGESQALQPGSRPHVDRDVAIRIGARPTVRNESTSSRVAIERTQVEVTHAGFVISPAGAPDVLTNGWSTALDAGWLVTRAACRPFEPVESGGRAVIGAPGRCPPGAEVSLAAAASDGRPWLIARDASGTVLLGPVEER